MLSRVLVEFHKEFAKPQVKIGFVEGKILSPEEVKALASLPTRDQLISQVMQLAQAPAQNFVATLNEFASQLVRTVDAVRDGMEKGTIQAGGETSSPAPAEAPEEAPATEDAAEATDGSPEETKESDS